MKLIIENWRTYLTEAPAEETIAPPDELSDEQREHLKGILASIYGILKGAQDKAAAQESAVEEGRRFRSKSRRKKSIAAFEKQQQQRDDTIAKIKRDLHWAHIEDVNLTAEQQEAIKQAYEATFGSPLEDVTSALHTIAYGNPLHVGKVRDLFNNPAGKAILAVVGGKECLDNFTLTCLAAAAASAGKGFFEE